MVYISITVKINYGVENGFLNIDTKDFEKMYHKNVIKHENRGPPSILSHKPKYPLKRI